MIRSTKHQINETTNHSTLDENSSVVEFSNIIKFTIHCRFAIWVKVKVLALRTLSKLVNTSSSYLFVNRVMELLFAMMSLRGHIATRIKHHSTYTYFCISVCKCLISLICLTKLLQIIKKCLAFEQSLLLIKLNFYNFYFS